MEKNFGAYTLLGTLPYINFHCGLCKLWYGIEIFILTHIKEMNENQRRAPAIGTLLFCYPE